MSGFLPDRGKPWSTIDYTYHYRYGQGLTLTLHETGNLQNIIHYAQTYQQPNGGTVFNRFSRDIFKEARQRRTGQFTQSFEGNYDAWRVVVSLRDVTIGGRAQVALIEHNNILKITAYIEYYFKDRFTDPLDWLDHSKDPRGSDKINDDYGVPYDILDTWKTTLTATIKVDSNQSRYPDDEFGE